MAGLKILVTAGPTIEDIDPVRFLSNRSSGKMGYAVAEAALRRGAEVYLISGPTNVQPPQGVQLTQVRSAAQMKGAVLNLYPDMDVVVAYPTAFQVLVAIRTRSFFIQMITPFYVSGRRRMHLFGPVTGHTAHVGFLSVNISLPALAQVFVAHPTAVTGDALVE